MSAEAVTGSAAVTVASGRGALTPLGVDSVRITGGFWADRQEVNSRTTLKHCLGWMERLGWIANFDRTAAGEGGERAGRSFSDSEIYKLLEALAWESARSGDAWAETAFSELSQRVIAAQQPDGYLHTKFGGPGQPPRYSDLEWGHELYCAGHLLQAAVARARTVGADGLVATAVSLADHICRVFGPDGIQAVCGHPEIEAALVELYRVTGEHRYLEQAVLFVARRGHGTLETGEVTSAYFVDDVPVRDADVLRGHAVRALYLAAGAVDVAIESGDAELLTALRAQWRSTVSRRTYLTGGMGSRHEGESFGEDFELPADRAYSETCAGVGSVMFSWRQLLAHGDEAYADLIERTLYNVIATSPNETGDEFFYVNPLQRDTPGQESARDVPSPRAASSQRAPWFEVSCCPTNVARTFASLAAYIATFDASGLQVHQYAPSTIAAVLPDGRAVAMHVETEYPDSGSVVVTVDDSPSTPWTLSLRVPAWALDGATIESGGRREAVSGRVARVTQVFRPGDRVVLELPLVPRLTFPHPSVDDLRGTAALEVGPLVYCLESVDQPDVPLLNLRLDAAATPAHDLHPGQGQVRMRGYLAGLPAEPDPAWPYSPTPQEETLEERELVFIPYHHWAERGPSTMRVFVPLADAGDTQGLSGAR
ncbi:MAG TPA: beta-L-arabinofuranosidase domain-containing protein [Streptosporangiaceae bacterium]|nr:beta-L-arabinofuranosidase domain-containing protein [Streptosporangiaceae bacterium]